MVALPVPGFQSFTALRVTNPDFSVTGDQLAVAQCLYALERLFELVQRLYREPAQTVARGAATELIGRYQDVFSASNGSARLYYEMCGTGMPLLLLHTAGADSRQFHDLLCDKEMADVWKMVAFDLPFHGRSFPTNEWCGEAYALSTERYIDWVASFIEQVVGEPMVLLGCSMGAAISVAMAAERPDLLRGVVALEAPDRSPGRMTPFMCHPRVNQAAHNPSYVRGLMAPCSPEYYRRLAGWYYSQGGLGIYQGDVNFYSNEYDGSRYAGRIDTSVFPVYLLTGEYDYSASPASSKRLAAMIPGAVYKTMPGLGHFPMTENPELLKVHLLPVLNAIRENCGTAAV